MLGYDPFRYRLLALILSGLSPARQAPPTRFCFGYVGATFASIQYSILPLLWVLLGGAGTTLGPFVGTLLMFYLIDLAAGSPTPPPGRRPGAPRPRPLRSPRPPRRPARRRPCHGCRDASSRPAASPATSAACTPSRTSTSTSRPARSTRSSARTAPARPPSSASSAAGSCPTPAASASTAATSPACPPTPACGRHRLHLPDHRDLPAAHRLRQRRPRRPAPRRPATSPPATFAALARVGLEDQRRAPAGTLAYGHQRLLEIAMGLALRPTPPDPRRADPGPRRRRDRRLQRPRPRDRRHRRPCS